MYKIDNKDTVNQIHKNTIKFVNKLNIKDKFEKWNEKNAYILFKDHKWNFDNFKQARLINPTEIELGWVRKYVIQKIVTKIPNNFEYNLWKNTFDTLDWFNNIENKNKTPYSYNLIK